MKKPTKHKLMLFSLALVAGFGLFGLLGITAPASAHQSPALCNSNDFVLNIAKDLSIVYDETSPFGASTIVYSVSAGNPNSSGSGCDLTINTIDLTTPDGVPHNLQGVTSYPIGTATALLGTVNYVVDSSDEIGLFVSASVNAQGDLHDIPGAEDPQDITKSVSSLVIHPTTITTISSSATQVQAGATVNLTITENNDGHGDLTNPHVVVDNGIGTLDENSANFSGDDGDGILEQGETWQWLVNNVVVNSNTAFTATGHGTDALQNDITYPIDPEEMDTVTIEVVTPSTITSISSSAGIVQAGGTVTLTVTETNDGQVDLTNPHVVVDNGIGTLDINSATFTGVDGGDAGVLDPGEVWTWVIPGVVVNSNMTFTATGHGTDSLQNDVTYPADPEEQDSVVIETITPSTITSISSSAGVVQAGGTVTLTVTETNDGQVDLTNPHVVVDNGIGTLDETSATFIGVDGANLGVLDPGEVWTWVIPGVVVNSNMTFTATGHGTDSLQNDITYPDDQEEQDSVTVEAEEIATRTLGFWQTHTAFTISIFQGNSGGSVTLGGMVIDTDAKLFGGFYSSISMTSTKTKRSALDQARMQLAQQWLAAELNYEAFGAPASLVTLLGTASTHFSTGTIAEILADASALDAYNNSGDSIPSNLNQGSATPKDSSSLANKVFWDNLN